MKLDDNVVIKTELIKVEDGSQLWGAEYKSSLADIFSVQDEVSKKISQSLRLRLSGEDEEKLAKRYTKDAEAYQLYLKGRYFWNRRNEEGFRNGIEYFKRAEEKDPTFALAFSGLADSYALLCDIGAVPPSMKCQRPRPPRRKLSMPIRRWPKPYTSRAFVRLGLRLGLARSPERFSTGAQVESEVPDSASVVRLISHADGKVQPGKG